MNAAPQPPASGADAIDRAAAAWVLKQDRGLTADEQDELSRWLAADPRHGAALGEHRWGWEELDRIAGVQTSLDAVPDPDLLAPPRPRRRPLAPLVPFLAIAAGAAAVLAVAMILQRPAPAPAPAVPFSSPSLAAPLERLTLDDGSVVQLNRGAVVTTEFSATERRVRLEAGEAHFAVAKDAARPFLVAARGVDVRAVGTEFNVRIEPARVDVVVTEGRVRVARAETSGPLVGAGYRAVVPLDSAAAPEVTALSAAEIERHLRWQPRMLDFAGATLFDIVGEFNRRNAVRLTISDPALGALRLSATFRSDNVEAFVRLMQSDFAMQAEWRSATEIVLSPAR